MGLALRRIIGLALIVAAVAGLVFSVAGIVSVWTYKQPLTDSLVRTVDLLDLTLEATTEALVVTNQSLTQASTDITALASTIETAAQAVEDTSPLLEELSTLVETDLPDAILSTQTALTSAQSSAQLIEDVLTIISNIPLLPLQPYNPPVPLDTALGDVVESLDALPQSLEGMEASLRAGQGNLVLIQTEFTVMAGHISEINTSLTDAQQVISRYQDVVDTLHQQVIVLKGNLSSWLAILAWFLTFALVWLGLTQLGLLAQGLEMFGRRPDTLIVEEPEEVVIVRERDETRKREADRDL